jgi:homoserine kinase
VSPSEAEHAAARAALLATAVITSDAGLLRAAMDDRLRQSQRSSAMPESGELIRLAHLHGAAGAALSGGGPSVLAICDSPISAHSVEKAWNGIGMPGMATRLRFDTGGAHLHAGVPAER